ncbi:MAG: UDP-N-acetylmuramoyl-tripeptide--D-alanyl-D-alanine ligase [Firmicutes bacterium]|nr:UDP-N-acetylmuramoyl-tripeptide--D-alanyl-D-alanine ligase [Bacillota bacterium]
MNYRLSEIADMTNGRLLGEDAVITGITKDSRAAGEGDMFIALKGERFDAHDFVDQVAEAGAAAAMVQREVGADIPQLLVEDVRLALGDFAREHCKKFSAVKVAVTGSTGKTTTRDFIAAVLAAHFKNVLKTQGNFNNDIGLPFTVLGMDETNDAAVIEMGMNHFGEIEYLTNIVCPDIAVITNVGTAHIENLGSREGILKAKCEIFDGMKADGLKILNADNDLLSTIKAENTYFFSVKENGGDIYASNIKSKGLKGISCTINTKDISFDIDIPIPGVHNVSNALAAAAVGLHCGLTAEEIQKGIAGFTPTSGRMDIIETKDYTVIDGAYNANPDSMGASLAVLKQADGFKCAVLGDMLELGGFSEKAHKQVGADTEGLDLVIAIGELSKNICEVSPAKSLWFENTDAFIEELDKKEIIPKGANVLVKASHSMGFKKIVEKLVK